MGKKEKNQEWDMCERKAEESAMVSGEQRCKFFTGKEMVNVS